MKIFISYSRRDMEHLDYLRKYLVPLEKYVSIEAWHDQRLNPADNWELELKKAMDECDLALFLLSADFLASEFINQRELPRLLERYELGEIELLPIILRPSLWDLSPLRKFQALPKDGTPIISFTEDTGDRDKVWTSIAEEIARKAQNQAVPEAAETNHPSKTPSVSATKKLAHHPESRVCMFCELVGLDDLRRNSTDETANKVTTYFSQMIDQSVSDFAELITVSDILSLFVFRSPSQAIATALGLQQSVQQMRESFGDHVNIRIGIHQGEVNIGESAKSGIVGRHVNCASQVSQICDPGQIIITSSVFDSAQGGDFGKSKEAIAWLCLGEYYLSSVGTMELFEVADRRVRVPATPDYERANLPVSARRFELADFELGDRLGEGSSGIVYSAIQKNDKHRVAVKVLSGGAQANEDLLESFVKEVETVSRLSHESIVKIIEFHKETMPYYYVMDYIDGKPINKALQNADWNKIVDTLIQVCDALQHAHENGIVHGDLKPNNILVEADGKPTVLDFGLSTLLEVDPDRMERSSTGTARMPLYLAPEQIAESDSGDNRIDIYAFGVLMYQLLTDSLPFEGSFQAVREAHLSAIPTLPVIRKASVPEVLQRICLKAMEKSPDRRHTNMLELKADLKRFKNNEPVHARPSVYNNLIEGPARKHVETIHSWYESDFITDKEHVALQRPYRRLLNTGLQAVSESRLVHLKVMLFYLGAWLVLAGCTLWISRDWEEGLLKYSLGIVLVAAIPALVTNSYWYLFYKRGAHRLAFVGMILGLLSLPFAVVTLAHEAGYQFDACWLQTDITLNGETVFPKKNECPRVVVTVNPEIDPDQIAKTAVTDREFLVSNVQAFLALLLGVAWSAYVARRSETITSAMVAGIQTIMLFVVMLDFFGFLAELGDEIASVGGLSMILAIVLLSAGLYVSKRWGRPNQATPLFGLALLIGILATQAIAFDLPSGSHEVTIQGLLEIGCGVLYLAAALFLYRRLRLESSAAYVVLLWLAPLAILGGLTYISEDDNVVYWLLLAFSVATVLYSARVQSFFYIVCGLGFTALSLVRIEMELLDDAKYWFWPIAVVLVGLALSLTIWFRDRKTRTLEDMDDVSERIIKNSLKQKIANGINDQTSP